MPALGLIELFGHTFEVHECPDCEKAVIAHIGSEITSCEQHSKKDQV